MPALASSWVVSTCIDLHTTIALSGNKRPRFSTMTDPNGVRDRYFFRETSRNVWHGTLNASTVADSLEACDSRLADRSRWQNFSGKQAVLDSAGRTFEAVAHSRITTIPIFLLEVRNWIKISN